MFLFLLTKYPNAESNTYVFAQSSFDSPIPKLLTQSSNSVTKLTDRKIRWIIIQKMKEILSTNDIALLQNVSGSRIRQIWCHYRITKTIPILAKPGRCLILLTDNSPVFGLPAYFLALLLRCIM
jgi:hypothetical protein